MILAFKYKSLPLVSLCNFYIFTEPYKTNITAFSYKNFMVLDVQIRWIQLQLAELDKNYPKYILACGTGLVLTNLVLTWASGITHNFWFKTMHWLAIWSYQIYLVSEDLNFLKCENTEAGQGVSEEGWHSRASSPVSLSFVVPSPIDSGFHHVICFGPLDNGKCNISRLKK